MTSDAILGFIAFALVFIAICTLAFAVHYHHIEAITEICTQVEPPLTFQECMQ